MSVLAITAALEALEAGDVELVEAILLGSSEDSSCDRPRSACRLCGLDCEWPGLRDDHERRVHDHVEEAEAA